MSETDVHQKFNLDLKNNILDSQTKKRLKNLLTNRLRDSGWTNSVRKRCTELVNAEEKDKTKLGYLMDNLLPYGRENIPEDVKIELLQQISDLLDSNIPSIEET
ncbi:1935_t:CDS:2 [Acaulospora morrowiae]|uniref:1935_t:CDS:1 n=1 Tax=Acaulospora morrowiae TaxID=94023 RepID=A0A9N8W920_9GLOM|nr:1935_t:CDS:2 [Acaulospora morrowiae]